MDNEMKVGVMTDVGFGLRDLNSPCLWFTLRLDPSSASLQVFSDWEDIKRIIKGAGVHDIKELNNKACWYEVTEDRFVRFKGTFDDPW